MLAEMPSRTSSKAQTRSLVADRGKLTESPTWRSAKDVFKTPKSPSPLAKRTRRSSIYQRKPAKADITKAKMFVSPPGVKTRARRSSIYQRGGGKLLSPGSLPARTRRTSMYVPSKGNLQAINEFSKVWATPVRSSLTNQEAQNTLSSENIKKSTPKQPSTASPSKSGKKSAKKVSTRSSKSESNQSPEKTTQPKTPENKPPSRSSVKKSATKTSKTPPSKSDVMLLSAEVELPRSTRKTRQGSLIDEGENPVQTPTSKTQKSLSIKKSAAKSGKRLPLAARVALMQADDALNKEKLLDVSTPKMSLGVKSFYSTPKQTPTTKLPEDLIQFSTGPKSTTRRKRVSVVATPLSSTEKDNSLRKQYRKTPKPPKSSQLDDSIFGTPASTMKKRKFAEVDQTESPVSKTETNKPKIRLSPQEMSSVLRSAEMEEQERERRLSESASISTTPTFAQKGRKISSKRLREVSGMNESVTEDWPLSPNSSVELNDTIYSDSRSARCTIL